MVSEPVQTLGPMPLVHIEDIVRPWVRIDSSHVLREPSPPEEEFPEAFIEWGGPTDFLTGDTFREKAHGPAGEKPPRPGDVELKEEARTWSDFEISNPEDDSQKLVLRKINAIAFEELGSAYRSSTGFLVGNRQWVISFQNGYTAGAIPAYLHNRDGLAFEPVVLDPLTYIKEINWSTSEYLIVTVEVSPRSNLNLGLQVLPPQDFPHELVAQTFGGEGKIPSEPTSGGPIFTFDGLPIPVPQGKRQLLEINIAGGTGTLRKDQYDVDFPAHEGEVIRATGHVDTTIWFFYSPTGTNVGIDPYTTGPRAGYLPKYEYFYWDGEFPKSEHMHEGTWGGWPDLHFPDRDAQAEEEILGGCEAAVVPDPVPVETDYGGPKSGEQTVVLHPELDDDAVDGWGHICAGYRKGYAINTAAFTRHEPYWQPFTTWACVINLGRLRKLGLRDPIIQIMASADEWEPPSEDEPMPAQVGRIRVAWYKGADATDALKDIQEFKLKEIDPGPPPIPDISVPPHNPYSPSTKPEVWDGLYSDKGFYSVLEDDFGATSALDGTPGNMHFAKKIRVVGKDLDWAP